MSFAEQDTIAKPAPPPAALGPTPFHDNRFDIEAVKLMPGEYFVTSRDMMLVTVLGSCVAACVRDRVTGVGGMNHFMLPDVARYPNSAETMPARFGEYAMDILIRRILRNGGRIENLEAKLFGAGNVLHQLTQADIGRKNAQFVRTWLARAEIPVVADDLLDQYPCRVHYFPHSGIALVKKLTRLQNDTIFERERELHQRLGRIGPQALDATPTPPAPPTPSGKQSG
ncbi:chemoreceptor glutamine deamidase CheD [Amantichitinum ursilacus]|uniref:chemoreceptor glutamine deamidase CheD n=1 Tax=Amantichitinum ursilacus TaxID=857265 RepID=UPI001F01F6D8|nr:chemoreceptor glutamine deamidase CheD [Amantichitinum ursilacus]